MVGGARCLIFPRFVETLSHNQKKRKPLPLSFPRDAAAIGPASCGGWFPASLLCPSGTGRLFSRPPANKETSQRRLPHPGIRRRRERERQRLVRLVVVVVDASRKLFTAIAPFVLPPASASRDTRGADRPAPGAHLAYRGDRRGPGGSLCVPALGRRSLL